MSTEATCEKCRDARGASSSAGEAFKSNSFNILKPLVVSLLIGATLSSFALLMIVHKECGRVKMFPTFEVTWGPCASDDGPNLPDTKPTMAGLGHSPAQADALNRLWQRWSGPASSKPSRSATTCKDDA